MHTETDNLGTPMSYLADHTGCRGRADINDLSLSLDTLPHSEQQTLWRGEYHLEYRNVNYSLE